MSCSNGCCYSVVTAVAATAVASAAAAVVDAANALYASEPGSCKIGEQLRHPFQ